MILTLLFWLKCRLPRPLPVGLPQFNRWVGDLVRYSGLPDNESTRRVAANFILQVAPATAGYFSIHYLSNRLVRAAANQVALAVLKEKTDETKPQEDA